MKILVEVYLILSYTKIDDQSTLALLLRVRPAPSNLYTDKQYHHITMAPHPSVLVLPSLSKLTQVSLLMAVMGSF